MSELRLGWATHAAARYACEEWHYSKCLPTGKLVKVGVWEDGDYRGVVIFSRGASPWLGKRYGLDHVEICELTRVALREHDAPVSKIVAIALRMLRATNPGLKLVVSFADPARDHVGGIYQAGNWIYTGRSNEVVEHYVRGKWRHTRAVYHEQKGQDVPHRTQPAKYRYLYPLDAETRDVLELLRRPYPKKEPEPETLSERIAELG